MSGTGKSAALAELSGRGHHVVDTDYGGRVDESGSGRLWRDDQLAALLDGHDLAAVEPLVRTAATAEIDARAPLVEGRGSAGTDRPDLKPSRARLRPSKSRSTANSSSRSPSLPPETRAGRSRLEVRKPTCHTEARDELHRRRRHDNRRLPLAVRYR